MESKTITFLKDVDVHKKDYTIKVKIVKCWTTTSYKTKNDYFSIELVVIDEQNCKMQCTVMKKFGAQFRHMLQENQSIYINNPALAENRAKYKHVDLPHKIIFDKDTTVQIYNDFKGSVHGFGFAKFEDIISKKVGENDLIDVIGCIVNREPVKYSILEDGKQIPRLSVKLEDEKGEIVFLTLWQSYCENLMKFIVEHDDAVNVIIILQHGKVKWFQGNPYVNNSFSVARVFINSDIEEISLFKTRYHKKSVDAVSTSQHSISSVVESIQDDFVSDKSFCFISDIPEIDEAKSIILELLKKSRGKCCSKVTLQKDAIGNEVYECTTDECKLQVISAVKRFRIPLLVQDPTGTVTATMFDREARYILKTTASELLLNNDQYIGDDIIPKCFDSFMDQKFAFKIKIKDFNIENKKAEFYTISKLSDDPSVISLHDKKFAAEQPEDQSFDLPMTDFGSQSSPSIKDCVSCTGESGTPSSFDGHVDGNKTSIVDTSTTFVSSIVGVKRNLEKVYDVDDMFTTCSNKSRGSDKQDEDNENSKQKLLIPKIEK